MAEVTLVPTNKPQKMSDKNFGVASFKFNRWSAELDEAQTIEDAMKPDFWAHQAAKVMGQDKTNPKGMLDVIEVRKRDSGLYAELLIIDVGSGFIRVKLIGKYEPEETAVPDDVPFVTRWNPGKKAHEVLRKSDNVLMQSGFKSRAAAVGWITDHMRATAAA